MSYQLVTVWRDDEANEPIVRSTLAFDTLQDVKAHITATIAAGVTRIDIAGDPLPDGSRLTTVFIPLSRISGWYLWEAPHED